MLREFTIAALALLTVSCATPTHKADTSGTSPQQTSRQDIERMQALNAQLDSNEVQAYAAYLCSLPQPERWEKAKALLATNNLVVGCAFDESHPSTGGQQTRPRGTHSASSSPAVTAVA